MTYVKVDAQGRLVAASPGDQIVGVAVSGNPNQDITAVQLDQYERARRADQVVSQNRVLEPQFRTRIVSKLTPPKNDWHMIEILEDVRRSLIEKTGKNPEIISMNVCHYKMILKAIDAIIPGAQTEEDSFSTVCDYFDCFIERRPDNDLEGVVWAEISYPY